MVKLNQRNPEVRDYICDVIRFWVSEFDIDGIRLDAADVLDFDFMKALRGVANEVKPDFWLMGEVIHGDYSRWVNEGTLHSVTNYNLHKALYSGHNDHNYFEIAHTVKRLYEMGGNRPDGLKLYNFTDNHDVERIYTKLANKAHMTPVNILLYTLPGIPSIYYGSEFGIEGRKEKYSDDSLRPALNLNDYKNAIEDNPITAVIARLGAIRHSIPALSYGEYRELVLTNRQYAFSRKSGDSYCLTAVNNDDNPCQLTLPAEGEGTYTGLLSQKTVPVQSGQITVDIDANSGDIWVNSDCAASVGSPKAAKAAKTPKTHAKVKPADNNTAEVPKEEPKAETPADTIKEAPTETKAEAPVDISENESRGSYEDGIIRGLQEAIIARMEKNGPVTDQMRRDVDANTHHDSLINWIKSF